MNTRLRVGVSLFVAMLLGACARDNVSPGPASVTRDSAGITIVENDESQPAWAPRAGWRLATDPLIQVGNIPELEHQLHRVSHAMRLRDGGIAVANTGLSDVRVFDARGTHVRTIRFWSDPSTPAPQPIRLQEMDGDSLRVFFADGTIRVVDGQGRTVRQSRLASPGQGLEEPLPHGELADGTLLVRARHAIDPALTGPYRVRIRLLRYSPEGSLLGVIGDFDHDTILLGSKGGYVFGPSGYYATADSNLWYGATERFDVREMTPDGRVRRIFRIDRPAREVTGPEKFTYRESAIASARGTERAVAVRELVENAVYADTFPVHSNIVVDALGNVWVRSYQWFDIGGRLTWSVLDRDGRYLGEVSTPTSLEIHEIGEDFLIGRMANRSGQEAVYIWTIEKSSAEERPQP